ncbi:MAG: hypothetical protein ACUVXD_02225 [Thermodesulfobacteriota bacterium]
MKVTGKVVVELSAQEVEELLALLLDEDRDGALRFLKECLGKKVQEQIRPHCVPVFEVSYSPRQKDRFVK